MSEERHMPLIWSPIFIFLAIATYGTLHSLLASLRAKAWARRHLGEALMERYYRLFFNAVGILSLLPVLALSAWLPDRVLYVVPFPWVLLTAAGELYGVWILLNSLQRTGASDFLGIRQALTGRATESEQLRTGGFYARMRHPLYSGAMLVVALFPWMSLNSLALIVSIGLYLWVGAIFEERKLERHFGEAYRDYRARTSMFVPRLGFHHKDTKATKVV